MFLLFDGSGYVEDGREIFDDDLVGGEEKAPPKGWYSTNTMFKHQCSNDTKLTMNKFELKGLKNDSKAEQQFYPTAR